MRSGEGLGEVKNKLMSTAKKPDAKRGDMAFILAIILGLVVGVLIKK